VEEGEREKVKERTGLRERETELRRKFKMAWVEK